MNFFIFGPGGSWFQAQFHELPRKYKVYLTSDDYGALFTSKCFHSVLRFWFSRKVNRIVNMPFKKVWYHAMVWKMKKMSKGESVFIFLKDNYFSLDTDFLDYLKSKMKHAHYIFWLQDILSATKMEGINLAGFVKKNFDHVITYDPREAEKYDFTYIETPYSRITDISSPSKKLLWDVIYVGNAKVEKEPQRYQIISEAYKWFVKNGLRVLFYVNGVPEELQILGENIVYNRWLEYEEIIRLVNETKCILEVAQKNATGTTLRMFEAIAYNKKLLVNNAALLKHKLYDQRFMKYYESPEDIDLDFIRNNEEVQYAGYEAMLPVRFFDSIYNMIDTETASFEQEMEDNNEKNEEYRGHESTE